jgi:Radical SAM superfamily
MLPELPADLKAAQAMGISFFAGECEDGRLDDVLLDAWNGKLKSIYNHMDKLPALTGEPTPFLPLKHVKRTTGAASNMDLGRGCPYQCSFCTIINVQGRKSRCRTPDDVERIIRENHAQNISCFIVTDDNFARNSDWEVLFDRIIHLRKTEFPDLVFTIQVDTLSHKIPNFIEKAAQAGVRHVFLGLENINPDNLIAAKKRQNKITEYREMIQKWREHGAITYAGYILGFPSDTKETILRDVEIIKRELPLDILEFFFLTPLPGSEDHKVLLQNGIWMDPDVNKYDLNHRVSHHSKMSDKEWEDAYRSAWASYYTPEHARTIFRRAAACKASRPEMTLWTVAFFFRTIEVEGVQPLEGGAFGGIAPGRYKSKCAPLISDNGIRLARFSVGLARRLCVRLPVCFGVRVVVRCAVSFSVGLAVVDLLGRFTVCMGLLPARRALRQFCQFHLTRHYDKRVGSGHWDGVRSVPREKPGELLTGRLLWQSHRGTSRLLRSGPCRGGPTCDVSHVVLCLLRQRTLVREPVLDALRPRIISGGGETEIAKLSRQVAQQTRRRRNRLRRIKRIVEAPLVGSLRHELRDAQRARRTDHIRSETAFLIKQANEKMRRQIIVADRLGQRCADLLARAVDDRLHHRAQLRHRLHGQLKGGRRPAQQIALRHFRRRRRGHRQFQCRQFGKRQVDDRRNDVARSGRDPNANHDPEHAGHDCADCTEAYQPGNLAQWPGHDEPDQ